MVSVLCCRQHPLRKLPLQKYPCWTSKIKDVEGKISMLETEEEKLLSTKPDDWQQERAYLREEKKQLREKKKQLREEKLLLLRKPVM